MNATGRPTRAEAKTKREKQNAGASVCVIYHFIHGFACRCVRLPRRAVAIMQRFLCVFPALLILHTFPLFEHIASLEP